MRFVFGTLTFITIATSYPCADGPAWKPPGGLLGEARERLNKGNYAEARSRYERALADEKTKAAAAIGLSRGWRAEGEWEKAESVLSAAITDHPKDAALWAERADVRFETGRWDEAEADANAAIRIVDEQFLARWTIARILRDRGKLDEADRAMRWFVRTYTARSQADKDIVDPDELMLVAHAAAENARWHRLPKQFSFILNEVIKDALKADRSLADAEALAGLLLLEKYNRPDAIEAFDKALEINPKCVSALVGKGLAAMQKFEIKDADQFADQALKINPKSLAALRLKADVHFSAGDYAGAGKHLSTAKAVNPRDAATLGKLAAVATLTNHPEAAQAIVAEAESYDAKPATFYTEYAQVLEDRKRYAMAEKSFLKAAGLRPLLPHAPLALGMLAMRMGKENDARTILAKAYENDPFNVRARNSIEVLKHLDDYRTIETPHYILRYDEKADPLLATFVSEYLEEIHVELVRQFQSQPPGKTLVQLFSTHEMFSGRIVGLPDLHTIGACTGPLFAMASPKAKGVRKPFNWGRVIRHELTHVFNLTATDYQCPHWLTEGLAVRNEQMNRPPLWISALRDRYRKNDLFTLETIMFGFVRPKDQVEWSLAYCQSQLYVEYLVKAHGEAAIAKLLDRFKAGDETPKAISTACGVDIRTFEAGYRKHVEEVLKPYLTEKGEPAKLKTFEELKAAFEADPDDLDSAATYAEQLARRNQAGEARKIVDGVLARKAGHGTATLVKSRLLMRAGDEDAARELVDRAVDANPNDWRLLYSAALLFLEAKQHDRAGELLEKGRKIAPLDADWAGQLTRLYTETDQTGKLLAILEEVVAGDPDELVGRMKLAKAALAGKKFEMAEKYAREAMQIDLTNPDVQTLYLATLTAAGKNDKAAEIRKRLGQ
jgi:tetratricopeptide (TPR) repeat protein